jgi:hypothetical protein
MTETKARSRLASLVSSPKEVAAPSRIVRKESPTSHHTLSFISFSTISQLILARWPWLLCLVASGSIAGYFFTHVSPSQLQNSGFTGWYFPSGLVAGLPIGLGVGAILRRWRPVLWGGALAATAWQLHLLSVTNPTLLLLPLLVLFGTIEISAFLFTEIQARPRSSAT